MLKPKEGVSIWPALVPEIHGTILCYDAQRKATLEGLDIATRMSFRSTMNEADGQEA